MNLGTWRGNNELKNPQEKYRTGAEQIQTSKKLEAIAGAMEEWANTSPKLAQ